MGRRRIRIKMQIKKMRMLKHPNRQEPPCHLAPKICSRSEKQWRPFKLTRYWQAKCLKVASSLPHISFGYIFRRKKSLWVKNNLNFGLLNRCQNWTKFQRLVSRLKRTFLLMTYENNHFRFHQVFIGTLWKSMTQLWYVMFYRFLVLVTMCACGENTSPILFCSRFSAKILRNYQ